MNILDTSGKLLAVLLAAAAAGMADTEARAENSSGESIFLDMASGDEADETDGASDQAAVFILDGEEDTDSEYSAGEYSGYISGEDDAAVISDLILNSGSYTFTGVIASGAKSVVRLENSTIDMTVDETASNGQESGFAVASENGAKVYVSDSDLTVDGAGRYVSGVFDSSEMIVNDSTFTSTGSNENTAGISEPSSNEVLLISGSARANLSEENSKTYFYNSTVTAEGLGALSTERTQGSGLDLYVYNSQAFALDGGYGTCADTDCRVWLYGSTVNSAEIGAVITGNGQITAGSGEDAAEDILVYNEGDTTSAGTKITAGRNAVMFCSRNRTDEEAETVSAGVLNITGGSLETTENGLMTTADYKKKYGDATASYIDYISGADILVKSTAADITLSDTDMVSYSGVLILSAVSSDSMGNFLSEGGAKQVDSISVKMTDMDVEGDILHMDYQRYMNVELNHTVWEGALVSGTFEEWQDQWKDYADDGVNWLPDESWSRVYGSSLTLLGNSVWTVTGDSVLSSLDISDDATVIVKGGVRLTLTDGTVLADGSQEEDMELHAADIR